mmetsp:Transcript_7235/g.14953  ORF Transcript_7235/g.14953 Transcript_7235/m.14953 type:complete len:306 (-) Transcript_7235:242-1159(-)
MGGSCHRHGPNHRGGHAHSVGNRGSVKGTHKCCHGALVVGIVRRVRKFGVDATRRAGSRSRNSSGGGCPTEFDIAKNNSRKACSSRVSLQICNQSLERGSGRKIRALVFLFDFFGVFRTLCVLSVDSFDLVKTDLAKRALVFPFRPLLDAAKTKTMVTAIDLGYIIWFYIGHADAAVDYCRRFLVIVLLGFYLGRRFSQVGSRRWLFSMTPNPGSFAPLGGGGCWGLSFPGRVSDGRRDSSGCCRSHTARGQRTYGVVRTQSRPGRWPGGRSYVSMGSDNGEGVAGSNRGCGCRYASHTPWIHHH